MTNNIPGKVYYSENHKWWRHIEKELENIVLRGITVECPVCRKTGVLTSRWVKGLSEKPKYVLHIKDNKVDKVCKLDDKQIQKASAHVKVLPSDIRGLLKNKKSFVLFSGGTDSICLLKYLCGLTKRNKSLLTAIYVDTTVGLPENIKYVKTVCNKLGVKLKIVRPVKNYFTMVKDWGIPSFRSRWCCRELKIKPIKNFLNRVKDPKVVFDGIRADESNVREKYLPIWYHPGFKCLSVSPIFFWSDERKLRYIKKSKLPKNRLHNIDCSVECWCGAYKTERNFRKLYELDKKLFNKLSNVETANKEKYTFLFKKGKRKPLRILQEEILKENNNG